MPMHPKFHFIAAVLTVTLTFLCPPLSNAMTVEAHGHQVFATGPVEDDLRKFEEALAKPGVDTVVFVNSPGGDLWTGLRVGRLIADKGLKTVIAGSCVSACSIMFMGGKQRQFSDAFAAGQTFIGIHGAHNKDTKQVHPQMQPQIFAFYKQHMGDNFNAEVMNKALYEMQDAGAMLYVRDPARSRLTLPYHCPSSQTPREKCHKFGADALSLGIVTDAQLLKLSLPAAFATSNKLLGKDLVLRVTDWEAEIMAFAQERCPNEACRTVTVSQIKAAGTHRAIAAPTEGKGFAWSSARETLINAIVAAIYQCNHRKNYPTRLCEAQYLNDFDVRHFHAEDEQAHKSALASVVPSKEKFYANEEFGGGMTSFQGLRTEKLQDITPQKLPEVRSLGTQELSAALHAQSAWQLIDVAGGLDTIPGSKLLLYGGLAFDDKTKDEAYKERFAALLALLAPDKAAPVVFFCASRNCWLSVNAAVRARQLGYSDVRWYRGGLESWKAASLPTAPNILRAVTN